MTATFGRFSILLLSGVLVGQAPLLAERSAEPTNEFAAIERGLAKAWVDRDEKAIDQLLAPDWTVIDISGHVLTKAEVLRQVFGSQERQIESGVIDEVKVRRLKDVAVVTGRSVVTGTYRGTRGTVTLRFTDVFELREGRWRIVASQGTRLAE